jgi:hypothetical protein
LLSIRATPREVGIGQPVLIEFDFKPLVNSGFCGLLVNFGDGTSEYVRVDQEKLPISLTRQYAAAGAVVIQADGKTQFQGLKTLFSCQGSKSTHSRNRLERQVRTQQRAGKHSFGQPAINAPNLQPASGTTTVSTATATATPVTQLERPSIAAASLHRTPGAARHCAHPNRPSQIFRRDWQKPFKERGGGAQPHDAQSPLIAINFFVSSNSI